LLDHLHQSRTIRKFQTCQKQLPGLRQRWKSSFLGRNPISTANGGARLSRLDLPSNLRI
jgi:hypothetical protein